ncbi:MAG: YihY/virulence factor BrkB family protein [Thermodesulforhabdaceae bacterium]
MTWGEKLRKALFSDIKDKRSLHFLWLQQTGRLLYLTLWKFGKDSCFDRAASLTFATIISLVPFAVLFVSFVGLLGGGEHIMRYVHQKILPAIAPEFQDELIDWLQRYISPTAFKAGPAGLINLVAVIGLFMGALNILVTAERVFNHIWKTRASRPYFQKVTAFWVLLTSSPFIILASISIGNLVAPPGGAVEAFLAQHWWARLIYRTIMPIAVESTCFGLMYFFLPSVRVRAVHAVTAGIFAALLWELTKRAFYFYVSHAVGVINFYKQIATVPLFFVWLFITWIIILWGCQLCYVLHYKKILMRLQEGDYREGQMYSPFFLGLFILFKLYENMVGMHSSSSLEEEVANELDMLSTEQIKAMLELLIVHGFVVEDGRNPGRYILARHPSLIYIDDVMRVIYESEFPKEARRVLKCKEGLEKGTTPSISNPSDQLIRGVIQNIGDIYARRNLETLWKEFANLESSSEDDKRDMERFKDLKTPAIHL